MEQRTSTKEFKLETVELSQKGDILIAQLARVPGIRPGLPYRWRSVRAQTISAPLRALQPS